MASVMAKDLTKGDLIEVCGAVGSHWAVYVGNGDVIHFSPDPDREGTFDFQVCANKENSVRKDKLRKVAEDSETYRNNSFDEQIRPYGKDEIVKRAHARLGESGRNLDTINCEHFATECRYGVAKSKQELVDEYFSTAAGRGANNVVSMFHHHFQQHGYGEKNVALHLDNCSGQNKNNAVIRLWCVMKGPHVKLEYNLMEAGILNLVLNGTWATGRMFYARPGTVFKEYNCVRKQRSIF